jgi:hypothetical protein
MKQLLIIAVSLLTLITGVGAHPVHNCVHKHVIKAKHSYQTIVINNDIDVVITESALTEIYVSGTYFVKKGVLYIQSKNGSLKGKATVHVPVSNLKQIEINGRSTVTSNGTLSSSLLKVLVNGEARFDLKNFGEILFEADEAIDLNFEKQNKEQHLLHMKVNSAALAEADAQMDTLVIKNIQ